jgi:hypothetical protein
MMVSANSVSALRIFAMEELRYSSVDLRVATRVCNIIDITPDLFARKLDGVDRSKNRCERRVPLSCFATAVQENVYWSPGTKGCQIVPHNQSQTNAPSVLKDWELPDG